MIRKDMKLMTKWRKKHFPKTSVNSKPKVTITTPMYPKVTKLPDNEMKSKPCNKGHKPCNFNHMTPISTQKIPL